MDMYFENKIYKPMENVVHNISISKDNIADIERIIHTVK